ncbi:uncharacterized protein BDR25DRAFT_311145 [Lindgomyces ingoldianus]|uniref:Uncharacterized protein n=1 Tax=Lindgomyces ingoldianus TaxID=673940 RepID=A0ACB6R5Z2_9PLEO|nr:uncharacterized protein BDR25DRAFT_311145 [Lindgomyces ingoldianus]KAF2474708.1 hypothetical protein BDR25DRAFT_311145 [Lindgomyces ingoldianus]
MLAELVQRDPLLLLLLAHLPHGRLLASPPCLRNAPNLLNNLKLQRRSSTVLTARHMRCFSAGSSLGASLSAAGRGDRLGERADGVGAMLAWAEVYLLKSTSASDGGAAAVCLSGGGGSSRPPCACDASR